MIVLIVQTYTRSSLCHSYSSEGLDTTTCNLIPKESKETERTDTAMSLKLSEFEIFGYTDLQQIMAICHGTRKSLHGNFSSFADS